MIIPFTACFLDGGPFFLNLTTSLVSVRRISEKEVTISSILGLSRLRRPQGVGPGVGNRAIGVLNTTPESESDAAASKRSSS